MRFTFHTDAGHGWLEVTRFDLARAHLSPVDFSRCSYSDGNGHTFYLEEDCDAPKFIAALEARGERVEIADRFSNGDSFVRALSPIY